jgi:hypothetical protein
MICGKSDLLPAIYNRREFRQSARALTAVQSSGDHG